MSQGFHDEAIRHALVEVWREADAIVHGEANSCPFDQIPCPHSISFDDLMTALSRVFPHPVYEDPSPPAMAN